VPTEGRDRPEDVGHAINALVIERRWRPRAEGLHQEQIELLDGVQELP
jgi:hypothetical protein